MARLITGVPAVEKIVRAWKDFYRAFDDTIKASPTSRNYRQAVVALAHNAFRLESLWNPGRMPLGDGGRRIIAAGAIATAAYRLDKLDEQFARAMQTFGWEDIPYWDARIAIEAIDRPRFLAVMERLRKLRQGKTSRPVPAPIVALANEARDAWLYQQAMAGVAYKSIVAALEKRTEWESIEGVPGIKAAIKRYCKRHPELPPVPDRQRGRKAK